MKTAAKTVVAPNLRSDEAALKVEVGDEALPAALEPEEPEPEAEPEVPVAWAEEPVWVAACPEEAAVTKPVAVEASEEAVDFSVALEVSGEMIVISNRANDVNEIRCQSLPTLWPSWAQLLAKNFREASLSAQFLEI
jgi:hypothetical protein